MNDAAPSAATPQPASPPARGIGRGWKIALTAAPFVIAGIAYAVYYALVGQFRESTDDAYVGANLVYVDAQVTGTVTAIGADDNQPVQRGQSLVKLDGADAAVALADAEARLGETVRQIRQEMRSVDEAGAVVAQRKTDLARTQDDLTRRGELAGTDALSAEDLAHATQAVASAKDALVVAQQQLAVARVPVEGTTLTQQPSVLRARAAYVQAYINAQRNDIPAPVAGFVARRSVQVGQRVAPGTVLMAVVPLKTVWVDANFKEPQLRNLRIGQPATVSADIYGGHIEYHGKVASISAGSGGAFSLLPPQNATGNWIKVVQRVPVRVVLDNDELAAHPLRVGLSTDVVVNTHDRGGVVDTALPVAAGSLETQVYAEQLANAETHADLVIAREARSKP
jgi:membrane fusion protein (multidrug efflux system)